jgi:hypothetical protein
MVTLSRVFVLAPGLPEFFLFTKVSGLKPLGVNVAMIQKLKRKYQIHPIYLFIES